VIATFSVITASFLKKIRQTLHPDAGSAGEGCRLPDQDRLGPVVRDPFQGAAFPFDYPVVRKGRACHDTVAAILWRHVTGCLVPVQIMGSLDKKNLTACFFAVLYVIIPHKEHQLYGKERKGKERVIFCPSAY
jgi:hypothetical protein